MENKKTMLLKASSEKGGFTPSRTYAGKRQSWNERSMVMRHVSIFNFSEVRVPGAYSPLLAACRVSYHSWPQSLSSTEFWTSSIITLMIMLEFLWNVLEGIKELTPIFVWRNRSLLGLLIVKHCKIYNNHIKEEKIQTLLSNLYRTAS